MSNRETKQVRDLSPIRIIRAKQVLELVSFRHTCLWSFVKIGQFIALIRVTDGITACLNKDAIQWPEAKSDANHEVEL